MPFFPSRIEVHHYLHFDAGQLAGIESSLVHLKDVVTKGFGMINQQVQDLVDAVAAQRGDINSMKVFIAGLEQQIKDALSGVTLPPDVQAALDGVFTGVKANSQEIKDAIDNDPATPAPPPAP